MSFENDKIKHLEFIQNIITRMNSNSFQIKTMMITIISAFLAIYVKMSNVIYIFLGIVPTILFWLLDAYYLRQERKFRGIYDNVADIKSDIEIKPFEIPIHKFEGKKYCFCDVLFSKTNVQFYVSIIFLLVLIGVIIKINK